MDHNLLFQKETGEVHRIVHCSLGSKRRTSHSIGCASEARHGDDTGSDSDSEVSTSSDEYVPGFLDDPEMVQGRHRHVMIGDRVTGCIVSSTMLYVDPEELKADLNKKFCERFDGWEPPKVCSVLIPHPC